MMTDGNLTLRQRMSKAYAAITTAENARIIRLGSKAARVLSCARAPRPRGTVAESMPHPCRHREIRPDRSLPLTAAPPLARGPANGHNWADFYDRNAHAQTLR